VNNTISVIDPGCPIDTFKTYLNFNEKYITHYKFAWGSSLLLSDLSERVKLLNTKKIVSYCGGTLFELAFKMDQIEEYKFFLDKNKIKCVEISDGSISIKEESLLKLIEEFAKDFEVIVEVGKKDHIKSEEMYPEMWINQINNSLRCGAKKVVLEGRESSNAGIFRSNGELRKGLIIEISKKCSLEKLIVEAPKKKDQVALIKLLGPNIGFGNIPLDDVFKTVALNKGLRGDTIEKCSTINWDFSN